MTCFLEELDYLQVLQLLVLVSRAMKSILGWALIDNESLSGAVGTDVRGLGTQTHLKRHATLERCVTYHATVREGDTFSRMGCIQLRQLLV